MKEFPPATQSRGAESVTPYLHKRTSILAGTFAAALACLFAALPAVAQCVNGYEPHPGTQSAGWVVTDGVSGTTIANGSTIPIAQGQAKQLHFHEFGNATGSCDFYTTSCSTYIGTTYTASDHLSTSFTTNAPGYSPGYNYPLGNVARNPSNYNPSTTAYESIDDSSSGTTGPIPNAYIYNPGTYTITLQNVINSPYCPTPINPASVSVTMKVTYQNTSDDKNLGCCVLPKEGQKKLGDSSDVGTGNQYEQERDYRSTTLPLVRHYNSQLASNVGLGVGWTTAYHRRLELFGTSLRVRRADGRSEPFNLTGGVWQGDPDTAISVTQTGSGFTVIVENGDSELYDPNGRILSVQGLSGKTWTWTYDPVTTYVSNVVDNFGNSIAFQYNANALMTTVTLPGGSQIQYAYDGNSNLTQVTYPDSSSRQYLYGNTAAGTLNQLTGIIDESATQYATIAYNASNQVSSTQLAGGVYQFGFSYASGSTVVTDPLGVARTYAIQNVLSNFKTASISGTSCTTCGVHNLRRSQNYRLRWQWQSHFAH